MKRNPIKDIKKEPGLENCRVLMPREKFDPAIVGYVELNDEVSITYSYEKIIDILSREMSREEAMIWFDYKMSGTCQENNVSYLYER